MKMKRAIFIAVLIVIIGGSIVWWATRRRSKGIEMREEEELPPLEVKGTVVNRGDVVQLVESLGRVESAKKREFLSPVNTTVSKVFVIEGEKVRKGEHLVKLQCQAEEAGFEKVHYELEKARRKYEFAVNHGSEDTVFLRITTGLAEAEQKFAETKKILQRLDIWAPFDGIVEYLGKQEGSSVEQGERVVSIYSDKDIYALAEVPQVEMDCIKTGRNAVVKSVGGEKFEKGIVASVSPVIGEKRTGRVKISIKEEWMIGEIVEVEIEKTRYQDRVRVTVDAVLHREDRYLVFVIKNGLAKWQWIRKGVEGRNFVEVLEGVTPGDTVLVEGQFTIAHDTPVKVIINENSLKTNYK